MAVRRLDVFGGSERRSKPYHKVVREVIPADWKDGCVIDGAVNEDGDVGSSTANVDEHNTLLAFLVLKDGLGACQRFHNKCIHLYADPFDTAGQILHRADGGSDNVRLDIESLAIHADGIADVVLAVHDIISRNYVENISVCRNGD